MSLAIYPGSFDPLTNGHLDIIKRAVKIFSPLVVTIGINPAKKGLFTVPERIQMIREVLIDEHLNGDITVDSFEGLLVDFVNKMNANVIIRGLRAVSDFEYEFTFSSMNRALHSQAETVFLMANEKYTFVSSNMVKEIVTLGGNLECYVPKSIYPKMIERLKER